MISACETLDLFRCLYGGTMAIIVALRLPGDIRFLRNRGRDRSLPRLLGLVTLPRLTGRGFLFNGLIFIGALGAASSGLWPTTVLIVATGSALLHFAQISETPEVRRKANTVPVILGLLAAHALAPQASAMLASFTLVTLQLLIAQIYFSSGLTKVRDAGWRWADGKSLRRWFAHYHLRDGSPLTLKLAGSGRTCQALATLTLGFELTFWLVIPFPSLAWLYLPLAILFHLGTAVLLRIHYWIYLGPAYLAFVAGWLSVTYPTLRS